MGHASLLSLNGMTVWLSIASLVANAFNATGHDTLTGWHIVRALNVTAV